MSADAPPPEVLVTVPSSPARVWTAAVLQAVLGALLVWIAFAQPPQSLGWRLFLLGAGALGLWSAVSTVRAGRIRLELTRDQLRDSTGAVLCEVADMVRIDRGVFAFKPARGFALVLATARGRAWVPGLWWRVGRRVGVGGTSSAPATRLMAEIIEALLLERARGPDDPR